MGFLPAAEWKTAILGRLLGLLFATLCLTIPVLQAAAANTAAEKPAEPPAVPASFCFDQAGSPLPCAGTGQDGDSRPGTPWPEPRFIDNLDGTVTDNLTGLTWLKIPACFPKRSWHGALEVISLINNPETAKNCKGYTAAHNDWSLPNANELASLLLVDESNPAAALNRLGFTGVAPEQYWSSTTAANPYNGWAVDFGNGSVQPTVKIGQLNVFPVRRSDTQPLTVMPTGQQAKAVPGDDGDLRRGFPLPGKRFIDHGDGTVTDIATGLMWRKNPSADRMTWQTALDAVRELNRGASTAPAPVPHTDWRLPSRNELASLVDHATDFPAIPRQSPFAGVPKTFCWTSTSSQAAPTAAWTVNFDDGAIVPAAKEQGNYVWMVRSTSGLTPAVWQSSSWKSDAARQSALAGRRVIEQEVAEEAGRFADLGNGTIVDNKTGLMWLKDAGCLGRTNLSAASELISFFNTRPEKFGCREYTAPYRDWRLPNFKALETLTRKSAADTLTWLADKGFVRVQPNNYWTTTPDKSNIYYGRLLNMKTGQQNIYTKSFAFFVWPFRPHGKKETTVVKPVVPVKPPEPRKPAATTPPGSMKDSVPADVFPEKTPAASTQKKPADSGPPLDKEKGEELLYEPGAEPRGEEPRPPAPKIQETPIE